MQDLHDRLADLITLSGQCNAPVYGADLAAGEKWAWHLTHRVRWAAAAVEIAQFPPELYGKRPAVGSPGAGTSMPTDGPWAHTKP